MIFEKLYHKSKIECIEWTNDNKYLIIGDQGGVFSVLNKENYQLVNYLESESVSHNKISCSSNRLSDSISIIGKNNCSVVFYSLKTF